MLRFLISTVACIGLVWALNSPLSVGSTTLPPLGKFLSPSHGFWVNAEKDKYLNTALRLNGVEGDIEIVFDNRLVPHIFASNDRDLYFAQGYVTAMHRLWQLDITVRASAGRVSEIMGESGLNFDKNQRWRGMTFGAENTLNSWKKDAESMSMMEAYSAGINEYIGRLKPRDYPLEFKLMNYRPEDWSVYKSALFVKSMCTVLNSNDYDLEFSTLLKVLGQKQFDFLFPEFNPDSDPIIPPGTTWDFEPLVAEGGASTTFPGSNGIGEVNGSVDDYYVGSNNWAVSGSKTASGNPILCNDPHLNLTLPSIWYEIHLNSPTQNCYGVSFPGMPFVMSGFNEDAAWGVTNVGQDVLDWYTIDWANDEKTKYNLDGNVEDVAYRYESFDVLNGKTVHDTVLYTKWGPVMPEGTHKGLAMRWISHDGAPFSDAMTFRALNKAKNVHDFLAALDQYHAPAQNFVFADNKNNIALRIGGTLPLRAEGQGRFVGDGSKSANGWTRNLPPSHNPVTINPERGFVSSANQRTTDDAYPYYYTGGKYFEDYRGNTLNRYLASMDHITRNDMQQLQQSAFSLKAEQILPALLAALPEASLNTEQKAVAGKLKEWDYIYENSQVEPIYFELFYKKFYFNTWDEFDQFSDTVAYTMPDSWKLIDLALNSPDAIEFDIVTTDERETFHDIALKSFQEAVAEYASLENDKSSWGAYHPTTIGHLARIPGLSVTLDDLSGHPDALNAIRSSGGPSWRMIVELNDPVVAHVVYPGGQSGNPGSRHYDDLIDDWANGRYFQVQFTKTPNEVNALYSLSIQKKGK
jgi:penicillin amidase